MGNSPKFVASCIVIGFINSYSFLIIYIKVKEFKDCKQTRATKCFSMHHHNGDSDECPEVPIIGVQITNTLQYVSYTVIYTVAIDSSYHI